MFSVVDRHRFDADPDPVFHLMPIQNWIRIRCTVLSPGFLASYWSAGLGTFLQVWALASH
jgi:hypothetical protein